MKKLYTFAVALISAATFAQTNLVTNGGFENWDSDTFPTGFSPAPYTASVVKEATIKHSGEFSAKHDVTATSKLQIEVDGIEAGEQYTISYYFLDNGSASSRMWSFWLKPGANEGSYQTLTDHESDLRNAAYSDNNPEWQLKTMTLTAPAEATAFRFEVRTYLTGVVYYDDFSIVKVDQASVKEDNIDGLNVYPNPANDIVTIASNGFGAKQVMLFDMLGKKVLETSTNETINVSGLKAGIYVMKITQDGKAATRKLVIK